jgi:hypothetical protein
MSLPHLDQTIELAHGEPRALFWQIGDVLRQVALGSALEPPRPVAPDLFLALPALQRVARRLQTAARRDAAVVGPAPRRPRRFRLKAEEVVAIMCYVHPVATGAWVELGKVQQKSLNLTPWIRFAQSFYAQSLSA